jgi:GMP synthase-like glutamine amidotransferase
VPGDRPAPATQPAAAGRILVLTHSELDGPGLLEPWAAAGGHRLELCRADAEPSLPDPRDYAALVVLGSVESVRNTAIPWIAAERQVVETAVAQEVPVLGICFGGQLLAHALGGQVSECAPPEVGWHVVESDDPATVPPGPWLLWHEERFTVPPGGREIARTSGCPHAFTYGPHMGVQFHPEVTEELLVSWVSEAHGRGGLADAERRALLADGAIVPSAAAPEHSARLFGAFASRAGLGRGEGAAASKGTAEGPAG